MSQTLTLLGANRQRGLQPGERADLVRFRLLEGRIQVVETYLAGQLVYRDVAQAFSL